MKTVSAAEANRNFSALLRDVAQGQRVTVTSRRKPVAVIGPPDASEQEAARQLAKQRLLARLSSQPVTGAHRDWTRDPLYD